MPRKARNYSDAPYYHVMVQGIKKEYVFTDDDAKTTYLRILKKYVKENSITIIAYCIMGNHAHFILKPLIVDNMSKCMQKANVTYAKYYNNRFNRVGYVFRDRYDSEEIYEKYYLHNCIKYIHMNPVKAKICLKQYDYKYSSYNNYLRKNGILTEELFKEIFAIPEEYNKVINNEDSECEFKDEELEIGEAQKLFDEYLHNKGMKLENLYKNNLFLVQSICYIKLKYKLKNKDIAEILGISASKVSRSLKEMKWY